MNSKIYLIAFAAGSLTATCSLAQTTTWTGNAEDGLFNNNGNWTDGQIAFNGAGIFIGAPTDPLPTVTESHGGVALDFQSTGWTILDGGGSLRIDGGTTATTYDISSIGAGVNRIQVPQNTTGGPAISINVGTGNTLVLSETNWPKDVSISGNGTLVFDGPGAGISFNTEYILSGNPTILVNSTLGWGAGGISGPGTWGGTGTISGYNGLYYVFSSANTIAPGGDGNFGPEIGTLSIVGTATDQGPSLVLDGASLDIQIGTTLGSNDVLAHQSERGGTGIALQNDAVLNLYGSTIEDGSYTIATSDSPNGITGTFSTVNFNGSPIDPSNFTVNYNTNDITVDITGLVPEPSTYALLMGLVIFSGLVIVRRRKQ